MSDQARPIKTSVKIEQMGENRQMLKTDEFARQCGVSNRHITRLIKRHETDIAGHFERRDAGGTWIDEVAQDFIRSKLRNPRMILPAEAEEEVDPKELELKIQGLLVEIGMLGKQLADAERRAGANAGAAALLEASDAERNRLQAERNRLIEEKAKAEARADAAEKRVDDVEKNAEKLAGQLKKCEDDNHLKDQTIESMRSANLWQRIKGWREK